MKKHSLKLLVCTAFMGLAISSCGGSYTPSSDTLEEKQREIYQLAVESGYSGSYEEWIASIRGENGNSILFGSGAPSSQSGKVGDGYLDTSTWDVYICSVNGWSKVGNIMGQNGKDGQDGKDGKDGVSVVSVTKTSSEGNVDTYTIKYSDDHTSTFTVTNGQDGQSIKGDPGQDGHTPVITIVDGYWTVDGVKTSVLAQGPQGDPGKDGVSVVSITKTNTQGNIDTYTIRYSDGNISTFTVTNGVDGQSIKGDPGQDGHTPEIKIVDGYWTIDGEKTSVLAQGPQGDPGKDGVSIVSIAKTGSEGNVDTYTITFSDHTTSTFTVTNGKDGQSIKGDPGKDGHTPVITIVDGYWTVDGVKTSVLAQGPQGDPGKDGQDGKDGLTPYIGNNGNWWIGEKDTNVPAKGQDGYVPVITIVDGYWTIDGVKTSVLAQGPQGDPGKDGQDGQPGADGKDGVDGVDGKDGQPGQDGKDGKDGQDGKTAWSNTILPSYNGYISVSVGSAVVGDTVTFYAYPDYNYRLSELYLNNINVIDSFDFATNSITVPMVEHGYVVRGVFEYRPVEYRVEFLDYNGVPFTSFTFVDSYDLWFENWVNKNSYYVTKPGDDNYDYEFYGWMDINTGNIYSHSSYVMVQRDTTFMPMYNEIERQDPRTKYGTEHEGTIDDPFTNSDAIIVAKNIDSYDAKRTFYIKGTLDRYYHAPENRRDGTVSFFLAPEEAGGEQFEIYRAHDKNYLTYSFEALYPGVEVLASGQLTMYGSQPETNGAVIEEIFDSGEPAPVMETHEVSVSEAINVANSLQDCNTTYDKYAVTGYIVGLNVSGGYNQGFYISDSLSDTENVMPIDNAYYSFPTEYINSVFTYGAKITLTDHIRNYHGQPTFNGAYISSDSIEVLEAGTSWPGMPTRILFYDMDGNEITELKLSEGEPTSFKYALEGEDANPGYVRFNNYGFDYSVDGDVITVTPNSWAGSGTSYVYNVFGEIIGILYAEVEHPYVAPNYVDYSYPKGKEFPVNYTVSLNKNDFYYDPSNATIKGFVFESLDTSIATVDYYDDSHSEVRFLSGGEVTIIATEIGSGLSTKIHFIVEGSAIDQGLVSTMDEIWKDSGIQLDSSVINPQEYSMFGYSAQDVIYSAYKKVCADFGAGEERVAYFDTKVDVGMEEPVNKSIVHYSSLINYNGYSFSITYKVSSTEGQEPSCCLLLKALLFEESLSLTAVGEPTFEIGTSFELYLTGASTYILYFDKVFSDNNDVAYVEENTNIVHIVGAGDANILCNLVNGQQAILHVRVKPDISDATLIDYSGNDFWRVTVDMAPEKSDLYLLPDGRLYMPGVDTYFSFQNVSGDLYFIQEGSSDLAGAYFTMNSEGVMGEVEFVPLDSEGRVGHFYNSSFGDMIFELGENGFAKVTFGEPLNGSIYVPYDSQEDGYHIYSPTGEYIANFEEDKLAVRLAGTYLEFPVEKVISFFEEKGVTVTPEMLGMYNIADENGYYAIDYEYNQMYMYVLAYCSTLEEMKEYTSQLVTIGYSISYPSPEDWPDDVECVYANIGVYVGDWLNDENYIGIIFYLNNSSSHSEEFPLEAINSFLEEKGFGFALSSSLSDITGEGFEYLTDDNEFGLICNGYSIEEIIKLLDLDNILVSAGYEYSESDSYVIYTMGNFGVQITPNGEIVFYYTL